VRQSQINHSHSTSHLSSEAQNQEEEKMNVQIQGQIQVLDEAEYMDDMIDQRQDDINKIGRIMSDIKDIGVDFVQEVDVQHGKLEDMNDNLEVSKDNTLAAGKEIDQANSRHRRSGKCLIIFAVVIVCILAALLGILFGTVFKKKED
jgi:t-SNARE complex subunit (syntaxin)